MTKITYIPGEIANAAIDEYGNRKPVTRTQHIFDDVKGKSQAEVNADIDDNLNQLSDEIDAVNKQDIIPVDTLPAVATADPRKIYRVVGEDSYTDYMVNASGDGWKTLATYSFPGIDDEPTSGSDNLVKSGSVFNEVNLIKEDIKVYREVESTGITEGYFLNLNGTRGLNSAWQVAKYAVEEGKEYYINGYETGGVSIANAYSTDEFGTTEFIKSFGTNAGTNHYDHVKIVAPAGCVMIAVTQSLSTSIPDYNRLLSVVPTGQAIDELQDEVDEIINTKKVVVCFGDSLTSGAGADVGNGKPYPEVLQDLLSSDYTVLNRGISGNSVQQILTRQGSLSALIDEDVEVSSTAFQYSPISLKASDGRTIVGYNQGIPSFMNPVYVDKKGYFWFDYDSTNGNKVCRMSNQSSSTILKKGDIVQFGDEKGAQLAHCLILFVGTNGIYDDIEELGDFIDNAIKFSGSQRALVIGITTVSQVYPLNVRVEQEAYMQRRFGNRYINLRNYFVSNGLQDAGITPTAQDEIDIANGVVPQSLRRAAGDIHYNATGYRLLGELVYNRGKALGYWD